ncbi:small ribosomal subunit protein mS26 [Hyperolius riggenbachi]|uniref:small ribosomal subunit protein mS26 n=1 Tax=Hyperolius riggenbachi TaxID=752182 RepID=UPI0035A2CFC2
MLPVPRASLLLRLLRAPCVTPNRGRKSRHDPPAKSKASRIKYPPAVCVEELLNIHHRYQEYTALVTALRTEFRRELVQNLRGQQGELLLKQKLEKERKEHEELMAWNLEENKKALRSRIERLRLEEEAERLQKEEAVRLQEEAKLQRIQEREEEVQRLEELCQTFITPENLTERIEAALDNPKSYNFCLDRQGRILPQRITSES